MADSSIEWTDATWNPTTGCDRTSPGCDHCYALTMSGRLKAMGQPKYQRDGDPRTSGPGFGLTVHPEALDLPRSWSKPRMIFVNSMSDLFHKDVPIGFIRDVFAVMQETPRHTYQVLTKRSKRLASIADRLDWPPNVWMGVSVESQAYAFRADHLRTVAAVVRFLSIEPLLGPVRLDLDQIDWVIAGGESGIGARPVEAGWVEDIRDDCLATGTPFFFKQWGGRSPKSGGALARWSHLESVPEVDNIGDRKNGIVSRPSLNLDALRTMRSDRSAGRASSEDGRTRRARRGGDRGSDGRVPGVRRAMAHA